MRFGLGVPGQRLVAGAPGATPAVPVTNTAGCRQALSASLVPLCQSATSCCGVGRYQVAISERKVIRLDTKTGASWVADAGDVGARMKWVLFGAKETKKGP